jgi:maleate isomerase
MVGRRRLVVTDTLAHRRIVGLLVPYFNTVVQPELDRLRPDGVTNQTARFTLDADVLADITQAAQKLAACGPDALIVGLSTESFPGGLELLEQGIAQLVEATSLPVFSATHANFAALDRIGAKSIALATPFDAAGNEQVTAAYEAKGFTVVSAAGLACADFADIPKTSGSDISDLFVQADDPQAEVLVQVGTGLPVLHLIDELEARFSKPVIASNQACYWQSLRELGVDDAISGCGSLFADY